MLSILIPVYNFDIRSLVEELHRQCIVIGIVFEIRCLDDGSWDTFKELNQTLTALEGVHYEELTQNVGRSKIRNLLGATAKHPYLLFMDCDSKVNHKNYIQLYIKHLDKNTLLYGGRTYQDQKPVENDFYLHWNYGIHREQQVAEQRALHPYHSFMTNNFLIPQSIFLEIKFEEQLTQYGHEDTLFGLALQKRKIPIVHLDNPLEHIGLEKAAVFLDKTKMAIENLWFLAQTNQPIETKLLNVHQKIKEWKLGKPLLLLDGLINSLIRKNLLSPNANLRVFDFYKLCVLLHLDKKRSGKG